MSRVLLIDSDPADSELIRAAFSDQGYTFQYAATGSDGLRLALDKTPSLVLLALTLPDQSGLDVLTALRERARTAQVPIMILAERREASQQNAVLKAGADDFIVQPFDTDILSLRVRNAIKRSERDGLHHPQTGLPTGKLIQERVRALADEYGWYKIDFIIDQFTTFREIYGFMTGQEIMNFAAELIGEVVGASGTADDFIGQKDDDEFVIVTRLTNGPLICTELVRRFDEGVKSFYNFMEVEQGFIEVDDGLGGQVQQPLMHARLKVLEGEPDDD
jgi:PleD family two-component response regulator